MAPRFWHFDTDVYGLWIGLALGPLERTGADWLTRRLQEAWPDLAKDGRVELDDPAPGTYADMVRIQTEEGYVIRVVRLPRFDFASPFDHGVLAHEVVHLVCGALRDLGVPHSEHEEEHAYLVELVHRRFLELLRGKGARHGR